MLMGHTVLPAGSQGLDTVHKQRVAEVLNDPENIEKRRSRESLNVDVVKYESGPDGGEEVSMSVEWNGVSTVHSWLHSGTPARPQQHLLAVLSHARPSTFRKLSIREAFCKFLTSANPEAVLLAVVSFRSP